MMSEKQKVVIKIYVIFCFIISFIMGIIGNISFFNILLRSVLFTIGGGMIAFALVSLFPILFNIKPIKAQDYNLKDENHEESVEDFESEDTVDGEDKGYTGPNASIEAQAYSNNNVDIDEKEVPNREGVNEPSQSIEQEQPIDPFGGKHEKRDNTNGNSSSVDIVLDNSSDDSNSNQKFSSINSSGFDSVFDNNDDYDFVPNTDADDSFQSYSSATLPRIKQKEEQGKLGKLGFHSRSKESSNVHDRIQNKQVKREVVKTVKEFKNSPEKVGKAVASWMKNSDNSN